MGATGAEAHPRYAQGAHSLLYDRLRVQNTGCSPQILNKHCSLNDFIKKVANPPILAVVCSRVVWSSWEEERARSWLANSAPRGPGETDSTVESGPGGDITYQYRGSTWGAEEIRLFLRLEAWPVRM